MAKEHFCWNCGGGNALDAQVCQWCSAPRNEPEPYEEPIVEQAAPQGTQRPAPMTRALGFVGWSLVAVGAAAMLFLCNNALGIMGSSSERTPGEDGFVITLSLALMAGVAIVFVLPGLLLTNNSRRR